MSKRESILIYFVLVAISEKEVIEADFNLFT